MGWPEPSNLLFWARSFPATFCTPNTVNITTREEPNTLSIFFFRCTALISFFSFGPAAHFMPHSHRGYEIRGVPKKRKKTRALFSKTETSKKILKLQFIKLTAARKHTITSSKIPTVCPKKIFSYGNPHKPIFFLGHPVSFLFYSVCGWEEM